MLLATRHKQWLRRKWDLHTHIYSATIWQFQMRRANPTNKGWNCTQLGETEVSEWKKKVHSQILRGESAELLIKIPLADCWKPFSAPQCVSKMSAQNGKFVKSAKIAEIFTTCQWILDSRNFQLLTSSPSSSSGPRSLLQEVKKKFEDDKYSFCEIYIRKYNPNPSRLVAKRALEMQ